MTGEIVLTKSWTHQYSSTRGASLKVTITFEGDPEGIHKSLEECREDLAKVAALAIKEASR